MMWTGLADPLVANGVATDGRVVAMGPRQGGTGGWRGCLCEGDTYGEKSFSCTCTMLADLGRPFAKP
jgi:hypothetical protein